MDTSNDFEFKRKKYMPTFPKATGVPTVYIEGYPSEDDEPMAANRISRRTDSDLKRSTRSLF